MSKKIISTRVVPTQEKKLLSAKESRKSKKNSDESRKKKSSRQSRDSEGVEIVDLVDSISAKLRVSSPDENPDENTSINDDEVWAAANAFFAEKGLVAEQLESYNNWVLVEIHKILELAGKLSVPSEDGDEKIRITLGNLRIQTPRISETDDTQTELFPQDALSRNITYSAAITVDITVVNPATPKNDGSGEYNKETVSHHESQPLGFIPVLVGSVLCNTYKIRNDPVAMAEHNEPLYDEGGYFIISPKAENSSGGTANRRVLVPQERASPNTIVILKKRKTAPKYPLYAEIRSSENAIHATVATVGFLNGRFGVVLPWIDGVEIPIAIIFRALGIDSEEKMAQLVFGPDFRDDREAIEILNPSLEHVFECDTQEKALFYIGSRGRKSIPSADVSAEDIAEFADDLDHDEDSVVAALAACENARKKSKDRTHEEAVSYAKSLLSNEFLPHIGRGEESFFEKARFAGIMTKKTAEAVLKRREAEDRDHYGGKNLITTGVLMCQQWYSALRRLALDILSSAKTNLRNHTPFNIRSAIKSAIVTNALQGGISANTWSASSNAKGISQMLEQYNHVGGIANKRKRNIQMAEGGSVVGPRDLHPSQEFTQCPAETPEGKNCGLVKNAALAAYTTVGTDSAPVVDLVKKIVGTSYLKHFPLYLKWTPVFVNGKPIGYTQDPKTVAATLRKYRRSAQFSPEVSIFHDLKNREILIFTNQGRFARALFVVENGELKFRLGHVRKLNEGQMTWTQLMAEGCVEIIDKLEEEGAFVVNTPSELEKMSPEMKIQVTHCELHPSLMYGVGGSLVPWPDHNPSPRNCYQCIHHEELVSMADGSKKAIGTVVVGDQILTVDPNTLKVSETRVVAHLLAPTEKKMYKIVVAETPLHPREPKTFTIRATFDHLFLTHVPQGKTSTHTRWMAAENLSPGSGLKVIIRPSRVFGCLFEGMLFCEVLSVKEIPNSMIADLTTESENHSFIANGFVVHNSAMGKQAVGTPFTNYNQMMTGTHHVMQHNQKPLALSRAACILNFDKLPAGQMATVLVAPRPKGEEDSLIFNRSSVDMGFMVSYRYTNIFSECREAGDIFGKPTEEGCEKWKGDARWVNDMGFARKGAKLELGDVIICKLTLARHEYSDPLTGGGNTPPKMYTVSTVTYDQAIPGIVHRIQMGYTGDGFRYIRIQICQRRPPVVADKFAARHGQKGTMGDMIPPEDMPFTASGINPDIIINCLAFPSRMTIAMLIELLSGKVVCSSSILHSTEWPSPESIGEAIDHLESGSGLGSESSSKFSEMFSHPDHPDMVDATPFRNFDLDVIRAEMKKYGFDCGDEIIYDGTTGQRFRSMAFFGVCFYQRLKHMVQDKKHARDKGPRNTLSRQPKEGKRDNGGLRIGTMERDCILAQGLSRFTRDRLMEQSDEFKMWVCGVCGMQAHVDRLQTIKECRICGVNTVFKIRIPYGSKLVQQELLCMNVAGRTLVDEFEAPK